MALITLNHGTNLHGGMGMHPTNTDGSANPCYDPARPSWLPYWLDTWSEGKCAYIPPVMGGPGALNPGVFGGEAPTGDGLDSTISSLAGIALVIGVVYIALTLTFLHGSSTGAISKARGGGLFA